MQVCDVMTYGAIGVSATATLAEAVETMLHSRVSALFVFDAEHALVGVLSEGDLLRRAELGTDRKRARWLEFLLSGGRLAESYAHAHGRKVGEIMTAKVVTSTLCFIATSSGCRYCGTRRSSASSRAPISSKVS
jgi:CBS-domain-containing membrane protein